MNRPVLCISYLGFFSLWLALPVHANDVQGPELDPANPQCTSSKLTAAIPIQTGTLAKSITINAQFVRLLQGRNERLLFELVQERIAKVIRSQKKIHSQLLIFDQRADLQSNTGLKSIQTAQTKLNQKMAQVVLISRSLLNIVQTDENNGLSGQSAGESERLSKVIAALHEIVRAKRQQDVILTALTIKKNTQTIKALRFVVKLLSQSKLQLQSFILYLKTKENREVLENLILQMKGVLLRQKSINAETKDLARSKRRGELAPEEVKAFAKDLSDSNNHLLPGELQLADRLLEALELLDDDESKESFPVILGELSADLRDLSRLLLEGDVSRVTLAMQVDVVKSIDNLIVTLKQELKKAKKAKKTPKKSKNPKRTKASPL